MAPEQVYIPIVHGPASIVMGRCLFAEWSPPDPKMSRRRRRRKRGKRLAGLLPMTLWTPCSLGDVDGFRIVTRPRTIPRVRLLHPDMRKP